MTGSDLINLIPLLILAAAPVIIMLALAFSRNLAVIAGFSIAALVAALVSSFIFPAGLHVTYLFTVDRFGLIIIVMMISAALLTALLSFDYLKNRQGEQEEFFIILFTATLGTAILAIASHFVTFFLGIETLSVSLYILVAYNREQPASLEAGIKYLVLASVSSAFLLFGMALIYLQTGNLNFRAIADVLEPAVSHSPLFLAGTVLIMVGVGFKLALVPFHMWTPDVYQGAPAPVSAFIASASKGAVMALLLRFFFSLNGVQHQALMHTIATIAILSMFTGNLLAIRQQNLKRLLAYSSIANLGYLMMTLFLPSAEAFRVAVFYLVAYMISGTGAFGVVSICSSGEREAENLDSYKGLFWKRPWTALTLTLIMLSLAGIPLTAGFMAKFYLVLEGLRSDIWILVFSLIISSIISLYYYLRVIATLFSETGESMIPSPSVAGIFFLSFIIAAILLLGILPGWLFETVTRLISM